MKTWRWIILFLGAGAVAVACGDDKKSTSDDDDGAAGGTPTATSTGTSTVTSSGTGTGTSTVTSSGTGTGTGTGVTGTGSGTGTGTGVTGTGSGTGTGTGGCTADLTLAGSDAACNACAGQYCCTEAEAFLASPDQTTYDALKACAWGNGGDGPCGQQCFYPYCGSNIGTVIFASCPTCVNGTPGCCTEFNACLADTTQTCGGDGSTTLGCLGSSDPSGDGCCSNTEYAAWDSCKNTNCSSTCSVACTP